MDFRKPEKSKTEDFVAPEKAAIRPPACP